MPSSRRPRATFCGELAANGGQHPSSVNTAAPVSASAAPPAPPAKKLNSKSPKAELEAFFNSPYAHSLKQQICEMGRRLWKRAYVDGNGGNMAIRVGEDIALCTPTLVSKGSLKPERHVSGGFRGQPASRRPRSAPAKF